MKKKQAKRKIMIEHRQHVYEAVLDDLIAGKTTPEHVTERWKKLKQIKGGK